MKTRQVSVMLFLTLLVGCTPTSDEPPVDVGQSGGPLEEVMITPDIVYGHKYGMALTFDRYQPVNGNGAAVIFIVSGGWVSRWQWKQFEQLPGQSTRLLAANELSPGWLAQYSFRPLLARGFTVFAVRHGSSPRFRIPEIIEDVRKAVRFIRYHAQEYGVDNERIGIWGASAGGHLALLLATTSELGQGDAEEALQGSSSEVAAVVAYSPPTDLHRLFVGWSQARRDQFPVLAMGKNEYKTYSPIYAASGDDPPTLIIHGDQDELVPIVEGESMHVELLEAGVSSKFVILPGAGHSFSEEDAKRAVAEVVGWFEQHLEID